MAKARKMTTKINEMPHLGNYLDELLAKKRVTKAELARAICKSAVTVGGYIVEASLHTRIIWDISKALSHDIFGELSDMLNINGQNNDLQVRSTKDEQIADLKMKVQDLEKEVTIYKSLLLQK